MKKRLGLLLAVSAMALGLGGAFAMSTVNGGANKVEEASAESTASKDYPMIVNAWDGWGYISTGLYSGCDVGLHCWGAGLDKTIKMTTVTDRMGVGIIPKGTTNFQVVRAESGSLPCDGYPSKAIGNGTWGDLSFDSTKNVITIKHWPNENDSQYYSDRKEILIAGRPVMFDLDGEAGNWWWNNDCTSYAFTNAQSDWYGYTSSDGWNKLTRIGSTGYMYFVPESTIIADEVIVSRNTKDTSGWDARQNQTTNMVTNSGFNPLYTTQILHSTTWDEQEKRNKQDWDNQSAVKSASEYGCYFMDLITCDDGVHAPSTTNWGTTKTFYDGLTADVQGEAWLASADEHGTNIEQGMARYDYIVAKYGESTYSNYIQRKITPRNSGAILLPFAVSDENKHLLFAVISSALVAMVAVGGYFLLRKKRI